METVEKVLKKLMDRMPSLSKMNLGLGAITRTHLRVA
jgi:hypothetical protein